MITLADGEKREGKWIKIGRKRKWEDKVDKNYKLTISINIDKCIEEN